MTIDFSAVVPLMVAGVILYGYLKDVDIFDCFVVGGKEGLQVCFNILPTMVLMLTAIGIFRESGAMDLLVRLLPTELIGIPSELTPIMLSRPISGSLAMASFNQLLTSFSPDSFIGQCASVMMGSTETTLYTIAVYFSAAEIQNYRHTLPSALIADGAGFIASVATVRLLLM